MKDFATRQGKMVGDANASSANTDNPDQQLSGQEFKGLGPKLSVKNHGNSGSQRKHETPEKPWFHGLGVR